MRSYSDIFTGKIDELHANGNYRYFLNVHKNARTFPEFIYEKNGAKRQAINFCSNDYLGMSVNADVFPTITSTIVESGLGSGGTRNISGTTNHHLALEGTISKWHKKEAALLFGSAYLANLTTLQTIGRHIPDLVFISDERNHASLIEGMRSAGNKKFIFSHNDLNHLSSILQSIPVDQPKLIVFESMYSMNGTISPVKQILELAKKYNALTYVDEVHAIGLYGVTGAGILEREGLQEEADIINGTFAKSLGVVGGYIAASDQIVDFIRSYGSGFIFTTSLPPFICAAVNTNINIIQNNRTLSDHVFQLVKYLRCLLDEAKITYAHNPSHITPLIISDAKECRKVANILLEKYGVYVQPVNYPTVPVGEECLRIILTARHTQSHVHHLLKSLKAVFHEKSKNYLPKQQAQLIAG
ncbi:MAG: 5-aminolevulinate synthase [Bacteroidota bacterium]|nr:5-aminolevulinate synthase [Bacteroidota bacterium]